MHRTDAGIGRAQVPADSSPAAFAPTGSDHRHPERGGCSAIELSMRFPRAGETKGYLSGQNPADYWPPGMERCPSHSGVSDQFVIEEIFHEMKDRHIGAWWPLHHWTDSKIQVHGLYCTIAVLLRALLWRRARQAGLRLSMSGLLKSLGRIRQVINIYASKRARKPGAEQVVLTKRDETQEKLIEMFGLPSQKHSI